MKKIVALVLSLVMVLGLATTAFAATTSTGSVATASITPVKAAVYQLATTAGASMTKVDDDVQKIDLTTVTGKIVADVPYYVPNVYVIDSVVYIQVAKASADHALYNNGAYTYLAKTAHTSAATAISETGGYATPVAMDAIVLPADDEIDCGDCYLGTDVMPYYVSGDDVYYAAVVPGVGTAGFAYFNGEFVKYDATTTAGHVKFMAHTWDDTSLVVKATDVKGVVVPVSVECSECEKTFKVVSAVTGFDNTWVKGVNYDTVDPQSTTQDWAKMNGYVIVLDGATDANTPAAPEASDKVESAETFDAGIAMYVGMSVMAAAGSAVVLKKKD